MGERITVGSGNVFRDLGFPDADERLARADAFIAAEDAADADPGAMALALLRRAMAGDGKAGTVQTGYGVRTVRIGHWVLDVCMDVDRLDYVYGMRAPDGRVWGYASVGKALRVMDPVEREDADAWLRGLKPWAGSDLPATLVEQQS